MRAAVNGVGGYLVGFASLFLIWHVASTWLLSSVLFPTPWKVFLKAIELAQAARSGSSPRPASGASPAALQEAA